MYKQIKQFRVPKDGSLKDIVWNNGWSNNLISNMQVEQIGIYGRPGTTIQFNILDTENKEFVLNNTGIFQMNTENIPITGIFLQESDFGATNQQDLIIDLIYTMKGEAANE